MSRLGKNDFSIRALHAIGIVSFVRYCARSGVSNPAIDEFVDHMWRLCHSSSLPDWDKAASHLKITGLGDPLPSEIVTQYPTQSTPLSEAVEWLREISATQMYGAYQPRESLSCLNELMRVTGAILTDEEIQAFGFSTPNKDGWGACVKEPLLNRWKAIAES